MAFEYKLSASLRRRADTKPGLVNLTVYSLEKLISETNGYVNLQEAYSAGDGWHLFRQGRAQLACCYTQQYYLSPLPHLAEGLNVGYRDGSCRWYSDYDGLIRERKYYPQATYARWVMQTWIERFDHN